MIGWRRLDNQHLERCEVCEEFTREAVWGRFEPHSVNVTVRTATVCEACASGLAKTERSTA